jgi:hypothetical protein
MIRLPASAPIQRVKPASRRVDVIRARGEGHAPDSHSGRIVGYSESGGPKRRWREFRLRRCPCPGSSRRAENYDYACWTKPRRQRKAGRDTCSQGSAGIINQPGETVADRPSPVTAARAVSARVHCVVIGPQRGDSVPPGAERRDRAWSDRGSPVGRSSSSPIPACGGRLLG